MEIKVIIKEIEWIISKTGLLFPIAIFDPIDTGKKVVSRVELYNKDFIVGNKIGIGDVIVVKLNSDVPVFSENLTKSGTYEIPTNCPVCNANLKTRKTKLFCTHITCKGIKAAYINHYCEVMNIKMLSIERINKMLYSSYFTKLEDLYKIKHHKRAYYNMFGTDVTNIVIESLENSITDCSLGKMIYALSICNERSSEILEEYCRNDIDTFMWLAEKKYDWRNAGVTKDCSDKINSNYRKYQKTFVSLSKILYFKPYIPDEEKNDKFVGITFVVSGKPKIFKRRDLIVRVIENYGGKVYGSLNKKIDYYIDCGSLSGMTKMAKDMGVKILTEQEFIEMVGVQYD